MTLTPALQKRLVITMRKAGVSDSTRMLICRMAMCGFSNKAIRKECGVPDYRIYQAQKWGNVRKADYRDATSPLGKHIVSKLTSVADSASLRRLERLLLR
jgi:hypothetical protein